MYRYLQQYVLLMLVHYSNIKLRSDLSGLWSGVNKTVPGSIQRGIEVGVFKVGRQVVSDKSQHLKPTTFVWYDAALRTAGRKRCCVDAEILKLINSQEVRND